MENTVLIEQTAKNIKLAEAIVLVVLFASIAAGLGGMYLSLTLGIAMFILAGIALICFMVVRVWQQLVAKVPEQSEKSLFDP